MENFLEGGIPELEAVKEAIADSSRKEQEYKDTGRSLKAKQKELEIQKKRVEEKISSTIKRSRSELERGYDDQISSADKAIKEAQNQKKNAKAAAVSLRMQRENSSLVDENKILAADIKNKFKEAKVPFLCNNRLYYALFAPKQKMDFIICAIALIICAGVIPFIVTRFINSNIVRVLVWLIIVAVFAALYFLVMSWTKKGSRNEVIKQMRTNIDQIETNKKFIKKRNKNIRMDPDESQYNLSEYDEQINSAKAQYDEAVAARDEAVRNFDESESVRIRQQMEEENASVFTELEKEIEQMSSDLTIRTQNYEEASAKLGEYTAQLGEKCMKAEKIDELIAIMNEGKAANIQEALDAQKNK